MQAPDEAPGASQAEQAAPAHGTAGSGRPGPGVAGRGGRSARPVGSRVGQAEVRRVVGGVPVEPAERGVVIILGAVVGLVCQERGLSFAAAFHELRRAS
jgi:hypothetical protein